MTDEERKKKREKHDAAIGSAKALTAGMCAGILVYFEAEPELFESTSTLLKLLLHIASAGIIITLLVAGVDGLYNRYCPYPGDTEKPVSGWRLFKYGAILFAVIFFFALLIIHRVPNIRA